MNENSLPEYRVRAANPLPALDQGWEHPAWSKAETAEIAHFREESSAHSPKTFVRLLHGPKGVRGVFHIDDQYVRSTRTGYSSQVWKDSCVEFFMQPKTDCGYINLEMNAGGAHLCFYVEDPTRTPQGLKKYKAIPEEIGQKIQVRSSLPTVVDPEIRTPLTWEANFFVPYIVLEEFVGPLGPMSGQTWRGNFYKCAEDLSHPHWASWSRVDELNFHLPRCFGFIHFD